MKKQNLIVKCKDRSIRIHEDLEPGSMLMVAGGYVLNDIFTNQNVFHEN